jgi:ribonuclease HII
MISTFENDSKYGAIVIGIDEVGRGSVAGPLIVAGIVADESIVEIGVSDSKKLSQKARDEKFRLITSKYRYYLCAIDPKEIDQINIHNAVLKAVSDIVTNGFANENLPILVDGKFVPNVTNRELHPVIGGDAKCASIAAASIVAKVYRDNLMKDLHNKLPHYNWAKNVGYLTKEHANAISDYGISKYHRKSFLKKYI